MMTDPSPTTVGGTTRRPTSRSSAATSGTSFGIPKTAEEAGRLLSYAERLFRDGLMSRDIVRDLTSFLGANSAAWIHPNRERLRKILSGLGTEVVDPIIAAMSRLPRTDILDECEAVLGALPPSALARLRQFVQREERGRLVVSVRASILRALSRVDPGRSLPTIHGALNDLEPEMREAAAGLLGEYGDTTSSEFLTRRLERETDGGVCASLRDAIQALEQ